MAAIGKFKMKNKRLILRFLGIPIGVFKGGFRFINSKARDFENKFRFPHATIDEGCSFTEDSTVKKNSRIHKGCIINHSHIGSYTYIGRYSLVQNSQIG